MKAIICGGRNFNPKKFKEEYPNFEQKLIDIFKENNVKEFEALWSNIIPSQDEPVLVGLNKFGYPYNKLAGINRNKRNTW